MQQSRVERAEYIRTQTAMLGEKKNTLQHKSSFPLQGNYLLRIFRRLWLAFARNYWVGGGGGSFNTEVSLIEASSKVVGLFNSFWGGAVLKNGDWRNMPAAFSTSVSPPSPSPNVRASMWQQSRLFNLGRISVLLSIHWKIEQTKTSYEDGLGRRRKSVGPWNGWVWGKKRRAERWSLKLKDHNSCCLSDRCSPCTWFLLLFKIGVKCYILEISASALQKTSLFLPHQEREKRPEAKWAPTEKQL